MQLLSNRFTTMANKMKHIIHITESEHLEIESLNEAGLSDAAELFYEAFSSKFKTVSDMPAAQRQEVLSLFWQRWLSNPYERHFQVKMNGKLVAIYGMTYGVKNMAQDSPAPISLMTILRKAGFSRFMKIRRIFQLFVSIPEPHTAYISYLCVDRSLRGMGIGNHVLNHITAQSIADPAITEVSLYVSDLNTKARELYLRCGFQDEAYETSRATKKYMGIYGWYYMTLPLTR